MNRIYLLLISVVVISISCSSTSKLIEQGNYDKAINQLVEKLAGKKNKKTKDVRNLELAFKKAQDKDLRNEADLKLTKEESSWELIYDIYQNIDRRQDLIQPLLPLVSKEGYQAKFQFVNVAELKKESKDNSIGYFYKSAVQLIEEARKLNNQEAARSAFEFLNKIDLLSSNYKDVRQLKAMAKELGTDYYLVKVLNNTFKIFPANLEENLLMMDVSGLSTNWKQFDTRKQSERNYKYQIVMNLQNLEFSPEKEKSRIIEDEYDETTTEVIKDKKGNPVKDSLGKVMKKEVITHYTSSIEEVSQLKTVTLSGQLEWFNVSTKNIDRSEPLRVEFTFNNTYGRLIKGDRSKVSKQNRQILSGRMLEFPSNERMTLDAGEKIKDIVKDIIHRVEH